jgi:hypothetical protein
MMVWSSGCKRRKGTASAVPHRPQILRALASEGNLKTEFFRNVFSRQKREIALLL